MPVFEDFQQITTFICVQNGEAPIIEDQKLGPLDGFQDTGEATVATGDGQRLEEPGDAVIHDAAIIAACFVPERTGNPTFAQPCWASNEQVLVPTDPAPIDERGHDGFVDATRTAHVDVFHTSGLSE